MSKHILEATYLVIDTETTGTDPVEDRVVEFAAVLTTAQEEVAFGNSLVNPGRDIPPEASGIHHLIDEYVADAPPLAQAVGMVIEKIMQTAPAPHQRPPDAYVAHNAPFDSAFLASIGFSPWLDTLRLAKRMRPGRENYQNQTLRYLEGLVNIPGLEGLAPHRALYDARCTAALLRLYLNDLAVMRADIPQNVEDLCTFLTLPVVLEGKIAFGKHKGLLWSQVPADYLTWMVKQKDMDQDLLATAHHLLNQMRGGRRW
jgi:exodeoxyribonuclease X